MSSGILHIQLLLLILLGRKRLLRGATTRCYYAVLLRGYYPNAVPVGYVAALSEWLV